MLAFVPLEEREPRRLERFGGFILAFIVVLASGAGLCAAYPV